MVSADYLNLWTSLWRLVLYFINPLAFDVYFNDIHLDSGATFRHIAVSPSLLNVIRDNVWNWASGNLFNFKVLVYRSLGYPQR